MKSSQPSGISGSRLESAAAWLVKLEAFGEAHLSPEELQAWDDWAADEDNRAAFDELAGLRQQFKAVGPVRRPTQAELIADEMSDRDPGASPVAMMPELGARRNRHLAAVGPSRWAFAVAASALLALSFAIAFYSFYTPSRAQPTLTARYSTRTGEQRHLALPDGSSITMGGSSRLSVAYTAKQRNVTLERGEALFAVAHNAARPFHVYAGSGVITDLGTRFNVLRSAEGVTVTVTEGVVWVAPAPVSHDSRPPELSQLATPRWLPVQIAHGEAMSYRSPGQASAVERVDAKLATAWVRGTLVYDRRPLSQVIEDVTRYWSHPVTLGPGTGELLYSGTVGERHIDAWVRGLPNIFPVSVTETNGGKVSIRMREH